jgi:2-keto-3-deoxy-L-rhamnonate aldolase RhmA
MTERGGPSSGTSFAARLRSPCLLLGTFVVLADPAVAEILGAAFDFLIIDMEHGMAGPTELSSLVRAGSATANAAAIVRVASNSSAEFMHALDAGATGVLVPQVSSPDEVVRAVSWCRYPPRGQRGWGPHRASGFGRRNDEYRNTADDQVSVIVQIERREAVQRVEEILAVDGLDAIFIGPNDLSGSVGNLGDFAGEQFSAAVDRILVAARSANVPVGVACSSDPSVAADWHRRGCSFVAVSADYLMLASTADTLVEAMRARLDSARAQPS